ncbi:hypothetical protein Ancab_011588 [Ancistrocladus abbreviatus]
MSGGFFRGTSAEQDTRFSNKQAKLLKTQKFAPELEHLVDITKVKMDVIKPWIAKRVTELLGFEDEVLINFIYGLLEGKEINGKEVQIQLTGFMEKHTGKFMKELWSLLLSAQTNASGVPQQFLDAKEEETKRRKEESERIVNEIQKRKEKESREIEEEKLKNMDGGVANDSALEPNSKRLQSRGSGARSEDEKEAGVGNGFRRRNRDSRSPSSDDRSNSPHRGVPLRSISKSFSKSRSYSEERKRSRSASGSPQSRRHSISPERRYRSLERRSATPHRRLSPRESLSPRRRTSDPRKRSPSRSRYVSPSPSRRRVRSPLHRGSPSPVRRRSLSPPRRRSRSPLRRHSPSPWRRRSPSPWRRRSPSPRWRRSPSPRRWRSPPSLRRRRRRSPSSPRSRSPIRRRSPSPPRRRSPFLRSSRTPVQRRSRSPVRRRSPSPVRRSASPSWRRSRSPARRRPMSPARRRPMSPARRRPMSPAQRRSLSPIERGSLSPVGRTSLSPIQRRLSSPDRRKSTVPIHSRSSSPVRRRSPSPDDWSSPSPGRHTSRSPVRMKSTKLQQLPVQSPEERVRNRGQISPGPHSQKETVEASVSSRRVDSLVRRQPISLSPQRDETNRNAVRKKAPYVSPLPEKSPSNSVSPPRIRNRTASEDRSPYGSPARKASERMNPDGSKSPSHRLREQKARRENQGGTEEEEVKQSREAQDYEGKSSQRSAPSSGVKQRDSPDRSGGKGRHDNIDLKKKGKGIISEEASLKEVSNSTKSAHKGSSSGERPEMLYSRDGSKADEKRKSHSKDAADSYLLRKSETSLKPNKRDEENSVDLTESEESDKRRAGITEKRKHKRSSRRELVSDDSSYDSEVEDRKEAKRRRKEEKRLRKEERRRRREERRRRKEEKRANRRKRKSKDGGSLPSDSEKNGNNANGSDDEHAARSGYHSSDKEETESEKKRLEIELREKALQSLRAKKGIIR